MEILEQFIIFINNILSLKIYENISILDLLIYLIFIGAITNFIAIALKGKKGDKE